eukprot:TRINITY_DN109796_c0_g1_i1.p1 TRINITY_DN109796_c0_g1~~TRINITY_DN109796_c0_g1_i1.p1  ORF type:complete len:105 (-),score=8.59 TRINITY_DN109796_c0_g1_i1:63-377(-)
MKNVLSIQKCLGAVVTTKILLTAIYYCTKENPKYCRITHPMLPIYIHHHPYRLTNLFSLKQSRRTLKSSETEQYMESNEHKDKLTSLFNMNVNMRLLIKDEQRK